MPQDMTGKEVDKYHLISRLGEGSFGTVYLGEDLSNKSQAAVKVLKAQLIGDELKQFLNEVRTNNRLKHAHIVQLLDFGIDEHNQDIPFLVLEYAPNKSLLDRLKRQPSQPLPIAEALIILSQIGQALQYAHNQGIVHRDLKPANILFNAKGDALLADFGIALIIQKTMLSQIGGTPTYMAPEQFRGEVSNKSDQYALGCIAYELLTGKPPFTAPNIYALGFQHVYEQPTPLGQRNPSLPVYLEQTILKAMEKNRDDRYSDISAFVAALTMPSQPKIQVNEVIINPSLNNSTIPMNVSNTIEPPKKSVDTIDTTDVLDRVRRGDIPPNWQVFDPLPRKIKMNTMFVFYAKSFFSIGLIVAIIMLFIAILDLSGLIHFQPSTSQWSTSGDWFFLLGGVVVIAGCIYLLTSSTSLNEIASILVLLPQGCVLLTKKKIYSVINYQDIEAAHVYKKSLSLKASNSKKETTPIDLRCFESPQTIAQSIVDAYEHFRATPK